MFDGIYFRIVSSKIEKIFYNISEMIKEFFIKMFNLFINLTNYYKQEKTKPIMINLNSKIPGAPNFKYKEFIKSDTAIRKGIDNTPTDEYWKNIEKLAVNVLQPARKALGRIRITSGYRSKELNTAIGGSKYSNHCKGEASDIESGEENVSLMELLEWIYNNCKFRTLILEYPPLGWCHVDYREGGNLKMLKLKDKNHNYETVSIDYIKGLYG